MRTNVLGFKKTAQQLAAHLRGGDTRQERLKTKFSAEWTRLFHAEGGQVEAVLDHPSRLPS